MSDLIDKLAEQATDNILGVPVLDKRKFAKLIAKDITATLMSKQDMTWQQNYARGWHDAALAVEKHFGVEE